MSVVRGPARYLADHKHVTSVEEAEYLVDGKQRFCRHCEIMVSKTGMVKKQASELNLESAGSKEDGVSEAARLLVFLAAIYSRQISHPSPNISAAFHPQKLDRFRTYSLQQRKRGPSNMPFGFH